MAQSKFLDRPVQLRRDEEEEYVSDEDDADSQQESQDEEGDPEATRTDTPSSDVNSSEDDASPEPEEDSAALGDISFGALAKAQATFSPSLNSRKRKASTLLEDTPTSSSAIDQPYKPPAKGSIKDGTRPNQPITRTSKHAPTILSSKHPVSRKRPDLFDPSPSLKHRDPRFDPTITSSTLNPQSSSVANKNYSFLTSYQATEILTLKSLIKKSKDPSDQADLKRQLMSMESKLRNAETQSREQEVRARHKRAEREAIREGRKSQPYFLKQSEVRKEVERERVDGMGKRARDKMEKRKVKRVKGKEMRDMPGITRRRDRDGGGGGE